jgi:chromate transport protein ChrA
MMTKSKMNMIRVARHVVIRQFVPAVAALSVAMMVGLIATMKTRCGTTKMILKCVPSATALV